MITLTAITKVMRTRAGKAAPCFCTPTHDVTAESFVTSATTSQMWNVSSLQQFPRGRIRNCNICTGVE